MAELISAMPLLISYIVLWISTFLASINLEPRTKIKHNENDIEFKPNWAKFTAKVFLMFLSSVFLFQIALMSYLPVFDGTNQLIFNIPYIRVVFYPLFILQATFTPAYAFYVYFVQLSKRLSVWGE